MSKKLDKLVAKIKAWWAKQQGRTPPATPPAASTVPIDFRIGYGIVNHWGPDVSWVDAAAQRGIGLIHIAFFGWGGNESYGNPGKLYAAYRALVARCQANGQRLFVEIANDNKGSGKYGDDGKGLSMYGANLRAAAETIVGIGGVHWLQPVGETGTDAGRAFEAYCAKLFPREMLVYNGGSRPSGNSPWSAHFAWHPANVATIPPRGSIAVSDHSGILAQFWGAGWQRGGAVNAELVKQWAKRMLDAGCEAVVLYDFGNTKADLPAMVAMRAAVSGGTVTTLPSVPPQPTQPGAAVDEIDLSTVTWDHADVSRWPITSALSLTSPMTRDVINMAFDKSSVWPANGDGLNANPWIIANIAGKWRAATWEWLRKGQASKSLKGDKTFGNHIKKSAWPTNWEPAKGETVYLMVSGLARDKQRNAQERTQALKVIVQ
jgi:hypothetical protein